MEKAQIVRSCLVEPILHTDVIDEGLLHPGRRCTCHHPTSDDDAYPVVEEPLSDRVGVVRPFARSGLVVGDTEVDIRMERLPEERIDLRGEETREGIIHHSVTIPIARRTDVATEEIAGRQEDDRLPCLLLLAQCGKSIAQSEVLRRRCLKS